MKHSLINAIDKVLRTCSMCGDVFETVSKMEQHKVRCIKEYNKQSKEYDDRIEDAYWYGG